MRRETRSHRAALWRSLEIAAAAWLGAAAMSGPAIAQRVDYTGSLGSATGKYLFTERTTSLSLFNGVSMDVGRLRLSATLPLLYQNSTAVTYIGGTPVPTGGPDADLVRDRQGSGRVPMGQGGKGPGAAQGMAITAPESETTADVVAEPGDFEINVGDPLLQADVDLHRGLGIVRSFSVSGVAKAPVADVESGIGTGEWDYGVGAMLSLGSGRTVLFANATYWVLGDMPELPLNNIVSYAASVGRTLGSTGRWSVLASVMGATSVIETGDAPLSAGAGIGYLRDGGEGISVGVMVGLSESSPDLSSYLGWRVPLGGRHE